MRKKSFTRISTTDHALVHEQAQFGRKIESFETIKNKYQLVFEKMLLGAFFQASDGSLIDANSKALQIFGLTRQEFLNRTSLSPTWVVIREDGSILPAEEHPSIITLKTGIPITETIVGVFNHQANDYVWVVINTLPLFSPLKKTPDQVYVTMNEITERKQAEAALSQSEERYRMLTETAPDAIITTDGEGRIVLWNHGAEEIYGYKANKIIGKNILLLIPERFREQHGKYLNRRVTQSAPSSNIPQEGLGLRKDGTEFNNETTTSFHVIKNEPYFTAFVRDISKRKETERKLHDSEELFRASFENAPIGICIFDTNGMMIQANMFCELCFGRSRDEIMQQNLLNYLHPDDREKNMQYCGGDHEGLRQPTVLENRYIAADGRTIYTMQHFQGVFDKEGNLVFIIVLTEDITASKQLSLMNAAIVNKLKDVHTQLTEFCDLMPENQKFLAAKSLSDYDLSPMESRIASMIFHGSSNKSISRDLCISENTVKHHITSIYSKFKVKNRINFINSIRINGIIV